MPVNSAGEVPPSEYRDQSSPHQPTPTSPPTSHPPIPPPTHPNTDPPPPHIVEHLAPAPSTSAPPSRQLRERTPRRPRPEPAPDAIHIYRIGRVPANSKRELERIIFEFAAVAPAQERIKQALGNAERYLALEETASQGLGYRAITTIPPETDLAIYFGTLHAIDRAPYSDHTMQVGEIGLEHECCLVLDGTPPGDSRGCGPGQLQLVNHSCASSAGCNTVCEWVNYGEIGMYVLTSSREIAEDEQVTFQYHPKRPPHESTRHDFWRDNRDIHVL